MMSMTSRSISRDGRSIRSSHVFAPTPVSAVLSSIILAYPSAALDRWPMLALLRDCLKADAVGPVEQVAPLLAGKLLYLGQNLVLVLGAGRNQPVDLLG